MIEFTVKTPTIPIPIHRLLKVVALVDGNDAQTRQLLEYLESEKFEVEVSDHYERDVSEDAEVGAYIALIDGDRRERARKLAVAVRSIGMAFQESFNRFPGFNYEVQGVYQERVEGRIKFFTYVVCESDSRRPPKKGGDRARS